MTADTHLDESLRFEFGANWRLFLSVLTDERIRMAEASLKEMLGLTTLDGSRFLDIGCGSGLFSLAARRLGAEVYSFDFDRESVACAEELKRRYFPADPAWQVSAGSVLDEDYMRRLGAFNIVYSWGVLHHTGAMWRALENACAPVAPGGRLFIAIYNDQGSKSLWWKRVKRLYNGLPTPLRQAYLLAFAGLLELGAAAIALARLQPSRVISRWTRYENVRGMSRWHDVVDWIGGYPFEVATPEAIFDFCHARGFALSRMKTNYGRMGCNEFVFVRPSSAA